MPATIKTPEEQDKMRVAGRLAAELLTMIGEHVKPGVTTDELNRICHDHIVNVQGGIPAPLNYGGSFDRIPFPKSICTSVNEVVCHGIPNDKPLKKGDIVNIDVTVIKDGYHGDTSKMFRVGNVAPFADKLIEATADAMWAGIDLVRPGLNLREVGAAIQQYIATTPYSIVRNYCGHGIGATFHEDPQVLHYDTRANDFVVEEGMCFTIEPMINLGGHANRTLKDGWTVVTKDRRLSAQWEHTLLVTSTGREVLTFRDEEADKRVAKT